MLYGHEDVVILCKGWNLANSVKCIIPLCSIISNQDSEYFSLKTKLMREPWDFFINNIKIKLKKKKALTYWDNIRGNKN